MPATAFKIIRGHVRVVRFEIAVFVPKRLPGRIRPGAASGKDLAFLTFGLTLRAEHFRRQISRDDDSDIAFLAAVYALVCRTVLLPVMVIIEDGFSHAAMNAGVLRDELAPYHVDFYHVVVRHVSIFVYVLCGDHEFLFFRAMDSTHQGNTGSFAVV